MISILMLPQLVDLYLRSLRISPLPFPHFPLPPLYILLFDPLEIMDMAPLLTPAPPLGLPPIKIF
jgi:hypothetical protein